MQKNKLLQKDYTTLATSYQISLPLNVEMLIPNNDPVLLVRHFIEGLDLSKLYHTYSHLEKNNLTPRQMLEIVVYANMNGIFSSRKIAEVCQRDINFMYLLEGKRAPDHATIARFCSVHATHCIKDIFVQMDKQLEDYSELSLTNIFIDGTKIESAANKYKFVWKKSVTKNMRKVLDKIPCLAAQIEQTFDVHVIDGTNIRIRHLKRLHEKLKQLQAKEHVDFVHGIGRKKTILQKSLEQLDEYIRRLKDYINKLYIAGNRNSFAKTDHDATFMLENNGQYSYIKPNNYEISKKRKYKKDIGRRENMYYCQEDDTYSCFNGKKLMPMGIVKRKSRTGYLTLKTRYDCKDCHGCPLKTKCIHCNNSNLPIEKRTKHFEVSKTFQEKRAKNLERITSDEGIKLRVNRSIQSEGAFSEVKDGLGFRRFLSRGNNNILVESMLLAIAHNINKLHHKIQTDHLGRYLFPTNTAA